MADIEPTNGKGRTVGMMTAGAAIAPIIPTTINEVFRVAEFIKDSGLAPYQLKNAQAVTVVLMKGLEIGLPPMAALECIGVINGRACIFGDGIPALLWSRGFKIKEWFENETNLDQLVAHCVITRPDGTEYAGTFSAQDAKDNGLWDTRAQVPGKEGRGLIDNPSPWYRYKKRMVKMRARIWTGRDAAADVLKGASIYEEQRDIELPQEEYREVAPAKQVRAVVEVPDIETTAEPTPTEEPFADPKAYLAHLDDNMATGTTDGEVQEIWDCNVEIVNARLSRTDRAAAEEMLERHLKRTAAPAAAE